MRMQSMMLAVVLVAVGCLGLRAAEEPQSADPFDNLVAATSALADIAQQLKPANSNVTAKQETVERKKTELADAEAAEVTAKAEFNQVLSQFLKAIDLLKEAAIKIQPLEEPEPVTQ